MLQIFGNGTATDAKSKIMYFLPSLFDFLSLSSHIRFPAPLSTEKEQNDTLHIFK